jgi:hypothetical protein
MTLGELRRSLDRTDLSDDLPITLAVADADAAISVWAPLTGIIRNPEDGVTLIGRQER